MSAHARSCSHAPRSEQGAGVLGGWGALLSRGASLVLVSAAAAAAAAAAVVSMRGAAAAPPTGAGAATASTGSINSSSFMWAGECVPRQYLLGARSCLPSLHTGALQAWHSLPMGCLQLTGHSLPTAAATGKQPRCRRALLCIVHAVMGCTCHPHTGGSRTVLLAGFSSSTGSCPLRKAQSMHTRPPAQQL
jgi:hypothetical protein